MPPIFSEDRGGSLRDLEPDFAAVIAPGLHLAFRDRTAPPGLPAGQGPETRTGT